MIEAVILDFNGTLYLDHDLNSIAWKETFESVKNKETNETWESLHDKNINLINDYHASKSIYEYFGYKPTLKMIDDLSNSKEIRYRQLAVMKSRNKLIDGLDEFITYLKKNNIKYCIASMAPKSNFDFYLDYLHLDKWFSYENIIYDDGNYENKNEQIISATKLLNVDPKNCLLIEDSLKNIKLAKVELNMKYFVYMDTRGVKDIPQEIKYKCNDFTKFDYSIFNN